MSGEKILVVDDSRNIREIFSLGFDEYRIVTAASAQEALQILRRPNDIDLLVLDVMMPGMNGLELLSEARRINKNCKVVIMTGYSSTDIAIEALRRRADDYIEKPFDINNVKQVFDKLLKEGGPGDSQGEDKLRLAQRIIQRNYNKDVTLESVSREVFLSYKYLSRMLKEKTGEGFYDYRVRLRVSSAKQLLKEGNDSINQISYKIGYHNPASFMKIFKKTTGLTPSQYRENCRRGLGATRGKESACPLRSR